MNINFKKEIAVFLAIFLVSSAFIYLLLNGGAYLEILKYELSPDSLYAEASADNKLISGLDEKNYYLYIPKIEVLAPFVLKIIPKKMFWRFLKKESDYISTIRSCRGKPEER
jgi:hypothetical protein